VTWAKLIKQILAIIVSELEKYREARRQEKGHTDRERIRDDPVGEFNRRYGMRSPEAKANPPGDDMDRPGG